MKNQQYYLFVPKITIAHVLICEFYQHKIGVFCQC